MGTPRAAARPDFHATVQLEMSRRGWGMRTLAKALAGGDSATIDQIEIERRAVRRWIKGAKPSQANRRRVAVALGLSEDTFDDEDEEDDLPSFLAREAGRTARRVERFLAKNAEPTASLVKATAGSDSQGG